MAPDGGRSERRRISHRCARSGRFGDDAEGGGPTRLFDTVRIGVAGVRPVNLAGEGVQLANARRGGGAREIVLDDDSVHSSSGYGGVGSGGRAATVLRLWVQLYTNGSRMGRRSSSNFVSSRAAMLSFLLALVVLGAVALIPLGLPGTWIMLAAAFGYNALAATTPGANHIGTGTLAVGLALAVAAEVLEFVVSTRSTTRYGGSRRAGWGAMLGGIAGAFVGIPVPIVGSVLGAFAGAFAGAFVAEFSHRADHGAAARVATGALVGRAVAAAIKTAFGLAIAVLLVVATL